MLMMVPMKIPAQTMHHVFVHEPRHKLHKEEGPNTYYYVQSQHGPKLLEFILSKQAKLQNVQ
jgi:hypothetical protein